VLLVVGGVPDGDVVGIVDRVVDGEVVDGELDEFVVWMVVGVPGVEGGLVLVGLDGGGGEGEETGGEGETMF
jgi:hypothetical protein